MAARQPEAPRPVRGDAGRGWRPYRLIPSGGAGRQSACRARRGAGRRPCRGCARRLGQRGRPRPRSRGASPGGPPACGPLQPAPAARPSLGAGGPCRACLDGGDVPRGPGRCRTGSRGEGPPRGGRGAVRRRAGLLSHGAEPGLAGVELASTAVGGPDGVPRPRPRAPPRGPGGSRRDQSRGAIPPRPLTRHWSGPGTR